MVYLLWCTVYLLCPYLFAVDIAQLVEHLRLQPQVQPQVQAEVQPQVQAEVQTQVRVWVRVRVRVRIQVHAYVQVQVPVHCACALCLCIVHVHCACALCMCIVACALCLQEDVAREVRGQAEIELAVVQREGAADREEIGAAQRVSLQLGQQRRERRLQ